MTSVCKEGYKLVGIVAIAYARRSSLVMQASLAKVGINLVTHSRHAMITDYLVVIQLTKL